MKRIILVHGWGGSSRGGWFDWIREELEKRNFEVLSFDMPDTENPKIKKWVDFLAKKIVNPDKDTYFIGHSVGCQTILRYLEKLPEEAQIGGCVFVAPWFNIIKENLESNEELKIAEPWIKKKIDFEKVKKHTDKFIAIFSDNDPFVPLGDIKLFEERIGSKTIIESNMGHFDKIDSFNSLLNSFLTLTE